MRPAPVAISGGMSVPVILRGRAGAPSLVVLAFVASVGAMVSLTRHTGWLWAAAWAWLPLAWFGLRVLRTGRAGGVRAATAIAVAHAATLLGVAVVRIPVAATDAVTVHPGFAEHPVRWLAGFPWTGVEGNGYGLAMDCVPFTMGVDAMLANFGFWLAVAWTWLRRLDEQRLGSLCWRSAVAAWVAGLAGGWRLLVLFD